MSGHGQGVNRPVTRSTSRNTVAPTARIYRRTPARSLVVRRAQRLGSTVYADSEPAIHSSAPSIEDSNEVDRSNPSDVERLRRHPSLRIVPRRAETHRLGERRTPTNVPPPPQQPASASNIIPADFFESDDETGERRLRPGAALVGVQYTHGCLTYGGADFRRSRVLPSTFLLPEQQGDSPLPLDLLEAVDRRHPEPPCMYIKIKFSFFSFVF